MGRVIHASGSHVLKCPKSIHFRVINDSFIIVVLLATSVSLSEAYYNYETILPLKLIEILGIIFLLVNHFYLGMYFPKATLKN